MNMHIPTSSSIPRQRSKKLQPLSSHPSFSPLRSPELALNELRFLYHFYKVCTGSSEGAKTAKKQMNWRLHMYCDTRQISTAINTCLAPPLPLSLPEKGRQLKPAFIRTYETFPFPFSPPAPAALKTDSSSQM